MRSPFDQNEKPEPASFTVSATLSAVPAVAAAGARPASPEVPVQVNDGKQKKIDDKQGEFKELIRDFSFDSLKRNPRFLSKFLLFIQGVKEDTDLHEVFIPLLAKVFRAFSNHYSTGLQDFFKQPTDSNRPASHFLSFVIFTIASVKPELLIEHFPISEPLAISEPLPISEPLVDLLVILGANVQTRQDRCLVLKAIFAFSQQDKYNIFFVTQSMFDMLVIMGKQMVSAHSWDEGSRNEEFVYWARVLRSLVCAKDQTLPDIFCGAALSGLLRTVCNSIEVGERDKEVFQCLADTLCHISLYAQREKVNEFFSDDFFIFLIKFATRVNTTEGDGSANLTSLIILPLFNSLAGMSDNYRNKFLEDPARLISLIKQMLECIDSNMQQRNDSIFRLSAFLMLLTRCPTKKLYYPLLTLDFVEVLNRLSSSIKAGESGKEEDLNNTLQYLACSLANLLRDPASNGSNVVPEGLFDSIRDLLIKLEGQITRHIPSQNNAITGLARLMFNFMSHSRVVRDKFLNTHSVVDMLKRMANIVAECPGGKESDEAARSICVAVVLLLKRGNDWINPENFLFLRTGDLLPILLKLKENLSRSELNSSLDALFRELNGVFMILKKAVPTVDDSAMLRSMEVQRDQRGVAAAAPAAAAMAPVAVAARQTEAEKELRSFIEHIENPESRDLLLADLDSLALSQLTAEANRGLSPIASVVCMSPSFIRNPKEADAIIDKIKALQRERGPMSRRHIFIFCDFSSASSVEMAFLVICLENMGLRCSAIITTKDKRGSFLECLSRRWLASSRISSQFFDGYSLANVRACVEGRFVKVDNADALSVRRAVATDAQATDAQATDLFNGRRGIWITIPGGCENQIKGQARFDERSLQLIVDTTGGAVHRIPGFTSSTTIVHVTSLETHPSRFFRTSGSAAAGSGPICLVVYLTEDYIPELRFRADQGMRPNHERRKLLLALFDFMNHCANSEILRVVVVSRLSAEDFWRFNSGVDVLKDFRRFMRVFADDDEVTRRHLEDFCGVSGAVSNVEEPKKIHRDLDEFWRLYRKKFICNRPFIEAMMKHYPKLKLEGTDFSTMRSAKLTERRADRLLRHLSFYLALQSTGEVFAVENHFSDFTSFNPGFGGKALRELAVFWMREIGIKEVEIVKSRASGKHCFLLCGPTGSGKSHLAKACAQNLLYLSRTEEYCPILIRGQPFSAWNILELESNLIKQIRSVLKPGQKPILILEDSNASEYGQPIQAFAVLMKYIHENEGILIVTSTLTPSRLQELVVDQLCRLYTRSDRSSVVTLEIRQRMHGVFRYLFGETGKYTELVNAATAESEIMVAGALEALGEIKVVPPRP